MHLRNRTRLDRHLTPGVTIPALGEIRLDARTTRVLHGERGLLKAYIKAKIIEVVKPAKANAGKAEKELPASA